MIIIRNYYHDKVELSILGSKVVVEPKDEALVDNTVGEILREVQPQLEYLEVAKNKEEETIKLFKKKEAFRAKAEEEEKKRIKKQVEEMNKQRKANAEAKAKEKAKVLGIVKRKVAVPKKRNKANKSNKRKK